MNASLSNLARCTSLAGLVAMADAPCALGQGPQFNLANYRHTRTHELFVNEASSVVYNPDRQSLFVIGDGADMIVEFNRFGTGLSMVLLSGFDDTEGIAYLGNGRFAVAEERIQGVSTFTWPASSTSTPTIVRSTLPGVTLGPNVGNSGLEGICFDPITGNMLAVKEKDPQEVRSVTIDFATGTSSVSQLCSPSGLGVNDLADIASLANVAPLATSPDRENLLIISQASSRLIEATRSGVVQSTLSLAGISATAEGVTIDERGVIYVVDESPRLYVFEPCRANFDWSASVDVQDIFAFITAWFAQDPTADIDGIGGITVADIFAFLNGWLAGC